jgi:hypothetical protein
MAADSSLLVTIYSQIILDASCLGVVLTLIGQSIIARFTAIQEVSIVECNSYS